MPLCRRHSVAPARSATLGGILFGVVMLFGLARPPRTEAPTTADKALDTTTYASWHSPCDPNCDELGAILLG